MTPPSLAELTAKALAREPVADAADLDFGVEPHDAGGGFRTDARAAWAETLAVLPALGLPAAALPVPSGWANVVRSAAPRVLFPMCVGHFPQMLAEVSKLAGEPDASWSRPANAADIPTSVDLPARVKAGNPEAAAIMQAAFARLAGDAAKAESLLADAAHSAPVAWQFALKNERAAACWDRGDEAAATAIWEQLPASGVRSFNLGMAAFSRREYAAARVHLTEAVRTLAESSGWNHLARLMLAVADR